MVITNGANGDRVHHCRHWIHPPLATMDRHLFHFLSPLAPTDSREFARSSPNVRRTFGERSANVGGVREIKKLANGWRTRAEFGRIHESSPAFAANDRSPDIVPRRLRILRDAAASRPTLVVARNARGLWLEQLRGVPNFYLLSWFCTH